MFASLTLVVLAGLLGPLLAAGRKPLVPITPFPSPNAMPKPTAQ